MIDRINKLKDLVTPKKEVEIIFSVEAIATYYPGFIQIYIPERSIPKLMEGFESHKKIVKASRKHSDESSGMDLIRSLRRTKKKIRSYLLCNTFGLFVTFTFDKEKVDRYNIEACKTKMADWLKNNQKRNGIKYLIVPEFHKDGALHFHAVIGNYGGKVIPSINEKTGRQRTQKGRKVFELPGYTLGYTNVKKVENTLESQGKLANYISKYITKDMPQFFGKQRYWRSDGLALPRVMYNPPKWYLDKEPTWSHQSSYGKTLIFEDEVMDIDLPGIPPSWVS